MDTLYKETEKSPDITSPSMMEECVNQEHDDNNKNETGVNINNMNEGIRTCSDITSPYIMVACEGTKHNDKNDNDTETSPDTLDPRYHITSYDVGMFK